MSKERARRRAEREAAAARAAAERAAQAERDAMRRERRERWRAMIPRPVRYRRPDGILARRRRAQNRVILAFFLLTQIAGFFLLATWIAKIALLVGCLFVLPVVVTLLFDRRRRG